MRTARTGAEALASLDGWQPDAALLDLLLPGMDGVGLAKQLCERLDRRTLLLAMTGTARQDVWQRAIEFNFDVRYFKPLDPEQVLKVLKHYAAQLEAVGRPNYSPAAVVEV